jgi:hypothetical protein
VPAAPVVGTVAEAPASKPAGKSPAPRDESGSGPAPSASWRVEGRAAGKSSSPPVESSFGLPAADPSVAVGLASESDLLRTDPRRPSTLAKPAAGTANPLTTYMAAWMTPRDFELLQVRPTEPNASPVTARMPVGREALRTGATPVGGGPAVTGLGGPGLEAPANPYLVDMTPKPLIGPKGPVAVVPSVAPPAAAVPANPGAVTPPTPPAPAANRLTGKDDAKFFPQLRRF